MSLGRQIPAAKISGAKASAYFPFPPTVIGGAIAPSGRLKVSCRKPQALV